MRRATVREEAGPRPGGWTVAGQAGLVDAPDPVALQHRDQAGGVVFVGVRQHEDVDPVVPGREPLIELDQEPVRVRPAVDDHPPTLAALDEDPVALPDVEGHDPRHAIRAMPDGERKAQC